MSYQKTILIGRLGDDPEIKSLSSGVSVCNFSMATSEVWIDKNSKEKQEKTTWHKVVLFGKQAENCGKYLNKGSKVFVEGVISVRSYDNKEGVKVYTTEINAKNVQFLDSKGDSSNQSQTNSEPAKDYNISSDANFAESDIPF